MAVSGNGKMLLNIIKEYNLNVGNFGGKCVGKWTHEVRTSGERSVLDYILFDEQSINMVNEVIIDESCSFCPFRVIKEHGTMIPKYSDHNAIIVNLEIEQMKKQRKNYWKNIYWKKKW